MMLEWTGPSFGFPNATGRFAHGHQYETISNGNLSLRHGPIGSNKALDGDFRGRTIGDLGGGVRCFEQSIENGL